MASGYRTESYAITSSPEDEVKALNRWEKAGGYGSGALKPATERMWAESITNMQLGVNNDPAVALKPIDTPGHLC